MPADSLTGVRIWRDSDQAIQPSTSVASASALHNSQRFVSIGCCSAASAGGAVARPGVAAANAAGIVRGSKPGTSVPIGSATGRACTLPYASSNGPPPRAANTSDCGIHSAVSVGGVLPKPPERGSTTILQ